MALSPSAALIHLLGVALCGHVPLPGLAEANFSAVYQIAQANNITNIVWRGLKAAQISLSPEMEQAFFRGEKKAMFQYAQQQDALEKVCAAMEARQIKYILLKGAHMRAFYPSPEMRTSCDIDILFQQEDKALQAMMACLGFTFTGYAGYTINFSYGTAVQIEFHRQLFSSDLPYAAYFRQVWDHASLCSDSQYGYNMSEEDFYAAMIAHFAKHSLQSGSGIRNALDIYLYNAHPPASFRRAKAEAILADIHLLGFEQRILRLTQTWFDGAPAQPRDAALTDHILGCGIYGTQKMASALSAAKAKTPFGGKTQRVFRQIFPSAKVICDKYPVLVRAPWLVPVIWPIRWARIFRGEWARGKHVLANSTQVELSQAEALSQILAEMQLDKV